MTLHISPDARATAEACARQLAGWMAAAIAQRGIAHTALSGGSTPKLMLEILAGFDVDWSRAHFWQVDERGVPPTDAQSNARMIRAALVPAVHFHRMKGEIDARQAAAEYAAEIQSALQDAPFDVVQCGIGDDGHTASLFPGQPLVLDRSQVTAGLWVEDKQQWRITLLPKPILDARHLAVLAAGAGKGPALRRALHGEIDLLRTPAQLLRGAHWFLDEIAAQSAK